MTFYKISCPQCQYEHDIPSHYLEGKESSLLKCANCHHVWRHFNAPLPEFEQQLRMPPPPPPMPEQKVEVLGALRNKHNYKKAVNHYHMDWWLLVIAVIIATLVLIKEVGSIPNLSWFFTQTQNFFSSIKHSFLSKDAVLKEDVKLNVLTSTLDTKDNKQILTVRGEVTNHSEESQEIPAIEVKLLDKNEEGDIQLRHSWLCSIERPTLAPGERRLFETEGDAKKNDMPASVTLTFSTQK